MNKTFSNMPKAIVFLCMIFVGITPLAQAQSSILDQYLVLLKSNSVPADFAAEVEALGGEVIYSHDTGFAVVEGLTPKASSELSKSKSVMDIQPDIIINLDEPAMTTDPLGIENAVPASPGDPTTAFLYPFQWNMHTINAEAAWAAGRYGGSPTITLAILDTGINYTYPDLLGRVDLSRSASFVPTDDALVDIFFPGTNYVTDLHYHGTHVASTAVSNSYFFAGVTTQATLMAVKVCSMQGDCELGSIISGLLHAVDNGADVANMSLGGEFIKQAAGRYVSFFNRIFNYANRAGVTIVVSAGNEAMDLDHDGNLYKAYCSAPNTICVSATGPTSYDNGTFYDVDAFASYSNYGRSAINVAAPGGNSGGLVWAACSQTSLIKPWCGDGGVWILGISGTSMAAAHVSGLAVLMVEEVGRNPGRVRSLIQQSADDLGQPGTDPYYGKGRINVGNAINR